MGVVVVVVVGVMPRREGLSLSGIESLRATPRDAVEVLSGEADGAIARQAAHSIGGGTRMPRGAPLRRMTCLSVLDVRLLGPSFAGWTSTLADAVAHFSASGDAGTGSPRVVRTTDGSHG